MKMELIEGSETSAIRTHTPGNYPKENILHISCPAHSLQNELLVRKSTSKSKLYILVDLKGIDKYRMSSGT